LGPEECPAVSLLPRHLESAGANNWKKNMLCWEAPGA
jgi:hypothetical protein